MLPWGDNDWERIVKRSEKIRYIRKLMSDIVVELERYDGKDKDWSYSLAGACATGAFCLFRILRQKGYEAYVATGWFEGCNHSFVIIKIDSDYYIADPTYRQFGQVDTRLFKARVRSLEILKKSSILGYEIYDIFSSERESRKEFRYWKKQDPKLHYKRILKRICV